MPSHSWESSSASWRRPAEARGPFYEDDFRWGHGSSDEDSDEDSDAGKEFVTQVLDHWMLGRLSAYQTTTLMFWAHKAGIPAAKRYMLDPAAPSGHASHKLKTTPGHKSNSKDLYGVELPGHRRRDLTRTARMTPFLPLHEQIAADWASEGPTLLEKLAEKKAAGDLPDVYLQHPVVFNNAEQPVIPLI